MKLSVLILIAIIGLTCVASAKVPESVKVRVGQSKTADGGKMTVKFLSVIEDSRCPINARCVWVGNARIRLAISAGKAEPMTIELNSNPDGDSVVVDGYRIEYVDLNPWPGENVKSPKTVTVSVSRSN